MSGTLPSSATADGIAGEYRLTLVGDSGVQPRRVVAGRLWLEPYEADLRLLTGPGGSPDSSSVYVAFGATNVDLAAVGAIEVGSTMSRDPARPGVVVLERHTTSATSPVTHITLRLGSDANQRDRLRFDGGYTALYVREISSDLLAGDWSSGAGRLQTGGHFCATRVDGR